MNTRIEGSIAMTCGTQQYTVVGSRGKVERVLSVGDVFEVMMYNQWQRVCLKSGGYRGRYIETEDGYRTRLAICMRARA